MHRTYFSKRAVRDERGHIPRLIGLAAAILIAFCLLSSAAYASVPDRISGSIDSGQLVPLKGSIHPLAQAKYDTGPVSRATKLSGISIYFKPSAAQQAEMQSLLQEQQTPGSAMYHHWLTPAQYASEFGLSSNDVSNIRDWLQKQGFQIDSVSLSGDRISFSGTAAQVEQTFQTQLHHYKIDGVTHMANATLISVPASISTMVAGVRNLSDFRPLPRLRAPSAHYTASNGAHYITPDDFATIYDVNAQYNAGYTGTGETIAVVGQSSIEASDISTFRSLTGLPASTPTMTLVPNSGTSEAYTNDEIESDIDVEWSGAVAKGATINFVYVGNNVDYSVFDSLEYAIEEDIAPVITISYGACEAEASGEVSAFEATLFPEANMQGQTIMAAAGDNGAADCEVNSGTPGTTATVVDGDEATLGAAVDYPGSSVYVTSMGGSEFTEGSGDYWNTTNNSDGGSALSFIPAEVWNDTSTTLGLDAGGGGKSILFTKPSWQTGTGVPADGARDVPDLALNASPEHDPYIICSSASSPPSCTDGFDASNGQPLLYGGTSFAAPTFAGLLTLINQQVAPTGQGNVNTLIYSLANSSSYSTAFHDITTGSNEVPCEEGSTGCTPGSTAYTATSTGGEIGYAATTGFDLASGWGSIDEYNLAQAFAGVVVTTSPSAAASFTLSATSVSVTAGGSGSSTVTVTPANGYTGTVAFTVTSSPALANSCYVPTNASVTGTSAATGSIMIYTSTSSCPSGGVSFSGSAKPASRAASNGGSTGLGGAGGAALASVLLFGFARKRRRFRSVLLSSMFLGACLFVLVSLGIGCGGGSSSTTSSTTTSSTSAAAGTYTITVTGANSTGSPTSTAQFTLTVE